MADTPLPEVAGLQLSNNTFSASPPGSLSVADECVMPQKGVIEPRRGQARAYVMPTPADIPWALTEFQAATIANYATDKTDEYGLGIANTPTVGFTSFSGIFDPVDRSNDSADVPRMKFGFGATFLHFCTANGPKTLETVADQPRASGLLRMPDVRAAMASASDASATDNNWLPYNSSVAYRSVLRLPTTSGASLLSPPSGRSVVSNRIVASVGGMTRTLASTTTVTVTFPGTVNPGLVTGDTFTLDPGEANFPAGTYTVTSDAANVITYVDAHAPANATNTRVEDFNTGARSVLGFIYLSEDATVDTPVRLYRSRPTSLASIEPLDEMFLVNEVFPTAPQIAQGYIPFADFTPNSVIIDPLYTNPQTGTPENQPNARAPLYRDFANWSSRAWYANATGLQTFNLQMLGVGAPDGVQDGDTITLDVPDATGTPYVFTFKDTPSTSDEVQIVNDGEPSFNIQQTSQNLILAINAFMKFDATPVRAYANSAQNEAPGKVLIQRTDYVQSVLLDDGAFGIIASRPASWVPALSDTTPVLSLDEHSPSTLYYSKLGEPEAVPLLNTLPVGASNFPIARIIALQNALIVFKAGDGIYSVTGRYPFQVLQISAANITAPDCCAQFADYAWAYTDQGILKVSDSGGATVISRQIETELNRLEAIFPTETHGYSFAVPYETERRIMFFVPFSVDAKTGRPLLKAWCYNNATQAWTGPVFMRGAFSGVVAPSLNKLELGIYDAEWATGRITAERKHQDYTDYADASFSNSIVALGADAAGLTIRLNSFSDVSAGDGIAQGQWATKIAALRPDLGRRWVQVYERIPWSVAACTVYKHYDVEAQFQPTGTPTARRTLTRLAWLFKAEWFANLGGLSTMLTDQIQAELEIATPSPGFGLTPFGQGPFGNPTPLSVDVNPINAKWASAAQFFTGFKLAEVWCKFRLQGFSMLTDGAAGPAGRGK